VRDRLQNGGNRILTTHRVLVTGAAGFLGSHLCDALVAHGHHVAGVDNFATGRVANLATMINEPRFTLVEQDICEPFDLGKIDYLFNFASPASPADYARLGPETLHVGSQGTRNALDLARKYNAGFLHASTSECYGDPDVHPQTESYWGRVNPIGPRSVYDEAKRFSEALIMAYHRYYSVDSHMVRIFNTYGPRLQPTDGRVISNLMIGILLLSRSSEHLPVNIGNPVEWTILDCAREVLAVTRSRSKIRYETLPIDDPMQRCPDITKAKALLGWEPKINLRQGLELSLNYFRASLPTRI
jgi:dTDP-glucose 4,6-dehydratase